MKKQKSFCCSKTVPNTLAWTIIGVCAVIFLSVTIAAKQQVMQLLNPLEVKLEENSLEQQKLQLTVFVNEAGDLIEKNGRTAFAEFKKQGGRWLNKEQYIFVYDLTGKTLVLPPQPNLENTNRLNVKDSKGIYYVKEMVNGVKTKIDGWVSYSYPKPGEIVESPKLAYFKKVMLGNTKTYVIVGSGIYLK